MKPAICILLSLFLSSRADCIPSGATLEGSWKFVPEKSTDLATWKARVLQLDITASDQRVLVVHNWMERGKVAFADSFLCLPGRGNTTTMVQSPIWTDNWFMGVLAIKGSTKTVSGSWLDPGRALQVISVQPVQTSQGEPLLTTTREYRLTPDGNGLTLTEQRSSRQSAVVLVFERLVPSKP